MKLTKKLEAEIKHLYETYWNSYINGDLKTYASLLDDDFKFIGSTEGEPLLNKKESIKFLETTADQLAGKAEFRNRIIKVELIDDLILITELSDGYILIETEWAFYSRFRLSSLLQKKEEGWKFIHQHVSMPDSKAQEGESFGLEQIRTENIQLRDAVKRRTIELENKNRELEIAMENLKSTQAQLIQSEKMASLGELTAGIAHEIQNPLNFVNNFSEVNTELIEELQTELKSGNATQAFSISTDIKENEQKINHHGRRADAIVKGMLQHSRSSSGQKELTDINALADEYLRLAYHGLRAKDNFFNATIKTEYDDSIGNINIIPQDIGRVILNLINNAFYAVTEKRKQEAKGYDPAVTLSTKKLQDKIEVRVADNGNGIPQKVVDKIFQPFFTTKPTGQGTGLGLSLSYDIVKAHGGEIKVESKEGGGSTFIIQLAL